MKSATRALFVALVAAASACGGVASGDSAGGGTPATPPTPGEPAVSCTPNAIADVAVASKDLNAYPPYAVSGCRLAYVATSGALLLRDLSTGAETTLASADTAPRRPTIAPALVAWEASVAGASVVVVRPDGSSATTIAGAFVSAGEPRATAGAVAFTAWNGPLPTDDTDVWLWDAATGLASRVLGGPAQQRFADVSGRYVAATDFTEDPDGRWDNDATDLADIVVTDRATGAVTARKAPGKQAFPMLTTTDVLAYLDWAAIHPEPKFEAFQLRSGTVTADPATDRTIADVRDASTDYARPAVSGSTVEWIANPAGPSSLWRAPADGSAPPTKVSGLDGLVLYAPAPALGFTVLAGASVTSSDPSPRLRAIPR